MLSSLEFYPLALKFDFSLFLIERQAGNHLEGIPFYGPRSDISGPEISTRLAGSKRSISDSAFTGYTRGGNPQMGGHDSLEGLHLMKVSCHQVVLPCLVYLDNPLNGFCYSCC